MKKILTAAVVFLLINTATIAQAVKKTAAKATVDVKKDETPDLRSKKTDILVRVSLFFS